jgi:hypothetical protein
VDEDLLFGSEPNCPRLELELRLHPFSRRIREYRTHDCRGYFLGQAILDQEYAHLSGTGLAFQHQRRCPLLLTRVRRTSPVCFRKVSARFRLELEHGPEQNPE